MSNVFSPQERDQIIELRDAVDLSLVEGNVRSVIVGRISEVEIDGVGYRFSQQVESKYRSTDKPVDPFFVEAPDDWQDVISGKWFEENITDRKYKYRKENPIGMTTLHVGSDSGYSCFLPSRDCNSDTGIDNVSLFDPYTSSVVDFDAPDYRERWDKVTELMLEKMNEEGLIYLTESWFPWIVRIGETPDPEKLRRIEEVGCRLFQVVRSQVIRVPEYITEELPLTEDTIDFDTTGGVNPWLSLGFAGDQVELYSEHEEDPESTNPFDYDPELVSKLTRAILTNLAK